MHKNNSFDKSYFWSFDHKAWNLYKCICLIFLLKEYLEQEIMALKKQIQSLKMDKTPKDKKVLFYFKISFF